MEAKGGTLRNHQQRGKGRFGAREGREVGFGRGTCGEEGKGEPGRGTGGGRRGEGTEICGGFRFKFDTLFAIKLHRKGEKSHGTVMSWLIKQKCSNEIAQTLFTLIKQTNSLEMETKQREEKEGVGIRER